MLAPFNLKQWIAEHRQQLQPPVGNAVLWSGDYLVMIVGGPNKRSDFHVNPTEELYYQVEGDIVLRVREEGQVRDLPIHQGDLFVLPPNVPHSPQRPAGTVGLVIELRRPTLVEDHMRWYCPGCGAIVHDASFHLTDLSKQLKPIIEEFSKDQALRTCKNCGVVLEAPIK